MDDGDGAIDLVERAEDGEHDGMVASETFQNGLDRHYSYPVRCMTEYGGKCVAYLTILGWTSPSLAMSADVEEKTPGASEREELAMGRVRRVSYATSIWSSARRLSYALSGIWTKLSVRHTVLATRYTPLQH